jgi:hypothetical protein
VGSCVLRQAPARVPLTLVGPEGDLRIAFVEVEPGANVHETALAAWKKVGPTFESKVRREAAAPPQDGWDEVHQIVYEVPAKDSRVEVALGRKLGARAVNLVRGTTAALIRRNAQLSEAIGSWKPAGFKKVSLKDVAASPWTEQHRQQLREFERIHPFGDDQDADSGGFYRCGAGRKGRVCGRLWDPQSQWRRAGTLQPVRMLQPLRSKRLLKQP